MLSGKSTVFTTIARGSLIAPSISLCVCPHVFLFFYVFLSPHNDSWNNCCSYACNNNNCALSVIDCYNHNIWFEGSNAVVCAQMGNLSQIKQKQCTKSTTISLKSFVWFSLIFLCSIKHLMALVPYLFAFRLFEKMGYFIVTGVWCFLYDAYLSVRSHDSVLMMNSTDKTHLDPCHDLCQE